MFLNINCILPRFPLSFFVMIDFMQLYVYELYRREKKNSNHMLSHRKMCANGTDSEKMLRILLLRVWYIRCEKIDTNINIDQTYGMIENCELIIGKKQQ